MNKVNVAMANHFRAILEGVGEDVNRIGLKETPERMVKAWAEILSGYDQDPNDHLKIFAEPDTNAMIISDKIQIISMCEHHALPFVGYCSIGYIPRPIPPGKDTYKVLGLSKLSRIARVFAGRLQVQERLTNQIADFLFDSELNPLGVGVYVSAVHSCIRMRGAREFENKMKTSALRGEFLDTPQVREEFFKMITI